MSTLKVNTINAATSGQAVAVAVQNPRSFRNLIINGAMQVAQRGTSSTGEGYATDRWKVAYANLDEAPTISQHALTSSDTGPWAKGFRYSSHIQNGAQTSGAGASDYLAFSYSIEAQDMAQSGWDYTSTSSYITLSFWVKSSIGQNFYGYIRTRDGTAQNFSIETGSLSANTWTKITIKIPGASGLQFDLDGDRGLDINLAPWWGGTWTTNGKALNTWGAYDTNSRMPDNTSDWYLQDEATFEITGVQLELGEVATDFEHRSYGDDLARCQRYFCKTYNQTANPGASVDTGSVWTRNYSDATKTTNSLAFSYPVTMRAVPTTITAYSVVGTSGKCSSGSNNPQDSNTDISFTAVKISGARGFAAAVTNSVTAGQWVGGHFTVDAEI